MAGRGAILRISTLYAGTSWVIKIITDAVFYSLIFYFN